MTVHYPGPEQIIDAHEMIRPVIHRTPVLSCRTMDDHWQASLYFKCENFQKAGAFKSRGATYQILMLTEEECRCGVATHSSGNHAQALARAARLRNVKAHVVMPSNSSRIKVEAVRHYGGIITFCEPTLAAREETLTRVMAETGALEIHPYNDYRTITGQATAAKEFIEEVPDLDYLIVPVGGGGLLSGSCLSVKYFAPSVKVIAAEPENANDAYLSFISGTFVPSVHPDTIADGLRTSLGDKTFPIILKEVHQVLTAGEDYIIYGMRMTWERMKILIEPSSAVPLAILLEKKLDIRGKKVGIILSGGNVDLDVLPW